MSPLRSIRMEINLSTRQLSFYRVNNLIATYPVAIGKPATPSPVGKWSIVNKKILNHSSVFGSRWLGLSIDGYGIHGTNNPSSIGKAVSNGCIRMYNKDVEQIFPKVPLGTSVIIHHGQKTGNPGNYGNTYTIQAGDTLWSISQKLGIPLHHLVKANPNINPNNLQVGQIIYLP